MDNSRLKFRAWDGESMIGPVSVEDMMFSYGANYDHMPWSGRSDNRHTEAKIMQFTGLLDKNGVEIYEGDIMMLGSIPAVIEWEDDMACFMVREEYYHDMDCIIDKAVIGNIYENPELLEK